MAPISHLEKGQLGGFGQRRKGDQRHRYHSARMPGHRSPHQLFHGIISRDDNLIGHADSQRGTAQQVHPQSTEGVGNRLRRLGVPDQQEGTDTGHLPERIHPQGTLRHDETEHRAQKEEQQHEEIISAVLKLRVMMVVSVHVAHRVDNNQAADNPHDQTHQNRQMVDIDVVNRRPLGAEKL